MAKRGRPPYADVLTPREWEVLRLLREGLTNEQIAERLGVSRDGAKYHVSEILSKLGVTTREEAAAWKPEEARPWWMGALTFLLWPVKRLPFGLATKATGVAVAIATAGGIGFLAWGLVVTNREGGSTTPTPTPSPAAAPWLQRGTPPVPLDTTALSPAASEAWGTVNPDTGEYQQRPPIGGQVPRSLAGGRYAVESTANGLAVLDAQAQTLTDIGPGSDGEVSPDGRWAAILPQVEGPTLAVVDVRSGARFDLGELGKPVFLAWSNDSRLAIVKDDVLYVAQPPDWAPQKIGPCPYVQPRWSPDGRWLAFTDAGQIRVATPDLSQVRTLASTGSAPAALAWSPDGHELAYGTASGVYAVSLEDGVVTNLSPVAVSDGAPLPSWSPDGSAVAFLAFDPDRQVTGIVVASADGSGAYQLTNGAGVDVLGWTSDGIIARVFRES